MSTDSGSVVRDRILRNYRNSGTEAASEEAATPATAVKDFLDEINSSGQEDAIWYSTVFAGAKEYIDTSGQPDIDITSLMHDISAWDEEDQVFIPKLDEHYTWQHSILYPALLALKSNMNILTVGPTGSGKTTFWENLAAVFSQPYYRLGGRGDAESDVILGRTVAKDGSTHFVLGEFTKAYTRGYMLLLDEVWKFPSNINMVFQRVLERNGFLQVDEAEGDLQDKQFYPDKRTILTLADNVVGTGDGADKYAATMIQDGSTINRVDMVLHVDYLPAKDEITMLLNRFGSFLPEHIAKQAVQVAGLVREGYKQGELSAALSPRNLFAWMEMAQNCRSYKAAFEWVILQRYADDAEKGAVMGHYQNSFGS